MLEVLRHPTRRRRREFTAAEDEGGIEEPETYAGTGEYDLVAEAAEAPREPTLLSLLFGCDGFIGVGVQGGDTSVR